MSAEEEGLPECRATGAWIQIWPSGNSKQMHARMQSCWSMASNMTEWNNRSHKSNSTDYTVNEADDLVMER